MRFPSVGIVELTKENEMENHKHATCGSYDVGSSNEPMPKVEKQVILKVNALKNKLEHLTEVITALEKELSTVLMLELSDPTSANKEQSVNDYVPLAADLNEQNEVVDRLIRKVGNITKRLEI